MKKRTTVVFCLAAGLSACGGDTGSGSNIVNATPGSHWSHLDQLTAKVVRGSGVDGTLSPADLYAHYNMPSQYTGAGQTIVIVDAPGSANVANDLSAFSSYYGLPQCDASNPCFQQINLNSGAVSASNDWDMEIGLDVE